MGEYLTLGFKRKIRSGSGAAWLSLARVAKRAVNSYKRAQLLSFYFVY